MNKKNIYLVISFLLFLLILSVFIFSRKMTEENKKDIDEYISQMDFLDSNHFIIENNVIRAEKIVFKVPDNWIENTSNNKISFYSKDIDNENTDFKLEKLMGGECGVIFQIGRVRNPKEDQITIAESISKIIETEEYKDTISEEETLKHELFFINGVKGLKTIFNLKDAKYIILEIPFLNDVYIFESDFIFTDACEEEFNKILDTISLEE